MIMMMKMKISVKTIILIIGSHLIDLVRIVVVIVNLQVAIGGTNLCQILQIIEKLLC